MATAAPFIGPTPVASSNSANAADVKALQTSSGVSQPGQNIWPTPVAAATKTVAPAPTPQSTSQSSASTTTISNANKINQVPAIQNTTSQLANSSGISTDSNGNPVYANGTSADNATSDNTSSKNTPLTPSNDLSTSGISQGGYVGDTYYAPGAVLPTDQNGNSLPTTATSPTDDYIMNSLQTQLSQADANTATTIQGIMSSYQNLIDQQEQANVNQQGQVNNALLMGGVTGQGSSAQYAPISSAGIMRAEVSYGIQQIANLQAKEQSAIQAAQKAGQNEDFQLQDKMNTEASTIRAQKNAAAQKVQDQITSHNQKLAAAQLTSTQDKAITDLYSSGVTDPAQILNILTESGMNITAAEVKTTLSTIDPQELADKKLVQQAGVTSPFANINGKFVNSQTGQAFATSADFFQAAGVSSFEEAYQKGLVQDVPTAKITYQTKNVNGQSVRFGFDAQGNIVSKVDLGTPTGVSKTSGSGGGQGTAPSAAELKNYQAEADQAFSQVKGTDGYVSPEAWNAALKYAQSLGITQAQFVSSHKGYINPADKKDYNGAT